MRKLIATLAAVALVGVGTTAAAFAAEGDAAQDCVTIIDVPEQVIHHDAVTHDITVIDVEAQAGFWANFSPNDTQGTYTGTPSYPTDAAGTWHVHGEEGGPAGGPGVFFVSHGGSGNGDWFYRQPAVEEVSHVETVVDVEAYDEVIPAVTHEECDNTPPVVPPVTPPVEPPVVKTPPTVVPVKPSAPSTGTELPHTL